MWKTKLFRFTNLENAKIARARMEAWLERRRGQIQYEESFVDNAYAIQYRKLMRVY